MLTARYGGWGLPCSRLTVRQLSRDYSAHTKVWWVGLAMLTPHSKVAEQGLQCSQQGMVGGACHAHASRQGN